MPYITFLKRITNWISANFNHGYLAIVEQGGVVWVIELAWIVNLEKHAQIYKENEILNLRGYSLVHSMMVHELFLNGAFFWALSAQLFF